MSMKAVREGILHQFNKGDIITAKKIREMGICRFGIDKILNNLAEQGNVIQVTENPGEFVVVATLRVMASPPRKIKNANNKDIYVCPHCKTKGKCFLPRCKCTKENNNICRRCNGLGWIYSNGTPIISRGLLDI